MKDDELLKIVKQDLENSKTAKESINKKIIEWRKLYNADNDVKVEGRSQYISKDTKKTIHWYIPNAMKPFQSTDDMVEAMPQTADDVERAKSQGILLNYQFNNDFDRFNFLHQSLFIMASEGTVIARTGWEQEEEEVEKQFLGLSEQEFQALVESGAEITQIKQDYVAQLNANAYSGTAKVKQTVISRPTAEVLRNEDFFIDPSASTIEKADFVIQRIETTMSELRKQDKKYNPNGIYNNVDDLMEEGEDIESALGSDRETKLKDYGRDDEKESSDKSRRKVIIYEYYGNIDNDDSGIAKPMVCTFSGNTIIRKGENPFPDKKPPFVSTPFSQQPFSFWGDALTDFIGDVQNVKTAIMRTFIDLMANSTNGMKHVKKGTIDAFNIKKLREAKIGTVVEWKDLTGYQPENTSEIPPSLMQMYELFTNEGENESGITRYNQGLNAQSLNKMLDIATPIPMADGTYKLLADIEDGDRIISRTGEPTTVIKAHEIHLPKSAYKLTFYSGEEIIAGEEHLWTVKIIGSNRVNKWFTVDTETLCQMMSEYKGSIHIPRVERPDFENPYIPELDPYLLGLWLGDGHSTGGRITTMDAEVIDYIENSGYKCSADITQNSGQATTYSISGNFVSTNEKGQFCSNDSLHTKLRSLGLMPRYGGEKHIPEDYFVASYRDRLELLRGLMDTDGCHHSNNLVIFTQKEGRLLNDVIRLIKSLGLFPKINEQKTEYDAKYYHVNFSPLDNPFKLKRKADKWKPRGRTENSQKIIAIKKHDIIPMRCLTVDAPDRLFAVGEMFTMTHNTATGITAIMNQSQMRIWETSSQFAENYLKPLMRKWLAYNQKWLSKDLAVRVAGDEYVEIKADDIGGKLDLQINVAISGSSEQKSQHIMQLFQTSMPLVQGGIVPPNHLGKLFSKLEELWGFKELSSELKKQIELTEQQQMQQPQGMPPQGMPMPQQPMQPNPQANMPQQGM